VPGRFRAGIRQRKRTVPIVTMSGAKPAAEGAVDKIDGGGCH